MEIVCFDHCQRSYLEVRSTSGSLWVTLNTATINYNQHLPARKHACTTSITLKTKRCEVQLQNCFHLLQCYKHPSSHLQNLECATNILGISSNHSSYRNCPFTILLWEHLLQDLQSWIITLSFCITRYENCHRLPELPAVHAFHLLGESGGVLLLWVMTQNISFQLWPPFQIWEMSAILLV